MRQKRDQSELKRVLASCRGAFIGVAVFSGGVNILMLSGSLYMLQVYDRVIPSRSIPTLIGLSILIAFLFALQGLLDTIRQRILTRIGLVLDAELAPRVFNIVVTLPLKTRIQGDGMQPMRDLDTVRGFLSGLGPTSLFDLPWLPLYLGLAFILHFWLGITTLVGAAILCSIALLTEVASRRPAREAIAHANLRNGLAEASRRNAEAIRSMGMGEAVARRWTEANELYLGSQRKAADAIGGFGNLSRVLRMLLQSTVLGVGALLVIADQATAGVMIAASILSARALAPIELAIAHWRGFVGARQSWARLGEMLRAFPPEEEPMSLPAPKHTLQLEGVSVAAPGGREAIVQSVSLTLQAGQGLGIIGPSASGKSSLVRAIVGLWPTVRGKIRLDGAALEHRSALTLGPHIGYMPQGIELFDGTVAENIARFRQDADSEAVVAAARAAGAHDMVLKLAEGYNTRVGEGGSALSAGQRQRVALARALYGEPFLVVLDEPNSNLDNDGEAALTEAIKGVRARGGIVVVVAHRPSALIALDQVLVLANGNVQALGPRDEVLRKVLARQPDVAAGPGAPTAQPPQLRAAAGAAAPKKA
jgi:ATP-binding cassette subfamily C protein